MNVDGGHGHIVVEVDDLEIRIMSAREAAKNTVVFGVLQRQETAVWEVV